MKNQCVVFLLTLGLLGTSITTIGATKNPLPKNSQPSSTAEEYSYYDEYQRSMETPEWSPPGTEDVILPAPSTTPEEAAEAEQSDKELEELLSKITE